MASGQLFGSEVLEEIEYGGLGLARRVRDSERRIDIAYLRLPAALLEDTPRFERLQDDCRRASELRSPHIAGNLGLREEAGAHYVGVQYFSGERLSDLMQKGPLAPARAVDLVMNVAEALARIHDRGWHQGVLRPVNIIVDRRGQAVVVDIGLAHLKAPVKVTDALAPLKDATTQELTRWAPHRSPEQAQGLKVDHRSDIFSLGSLLYTMLTGSAPFQRATGMESLSALLQDPAPRLGTGLREVERFQGILDRCLAREPTDRYLLLRPSRVFRREAGRASSADRSLTEDLRALRTALSRPAETTPRRAGCTGALAALVSLIATACFLLRGA